MIAVPSVSAVDRHRQVQLRSLALFALVASLVVGVVSARLTLGGHTFTLLALEIIVLPIILWRWPSAGIVVLVLAATVVEQFPFPIPTAPGTMLTDEILFFTSLTDGVGVSGVLINPLELTMAVILLVWLVKVARDRAWSAPRSPVAFGFVLLFGCVLMAAILGHLHGGDVRESLREARPWVYLTGLYFLGSMLLTSRQAIWAVLWALVIGTGIKGIQGVYESIRLLDLQPKPDYILSHEEAVFFSLFIFLTAMLWMFGFRGRLRAVATVLLPGVIYTDLANNRRTAWLMLMAGTLVILVLAWIRLPERRAMVRKVAIILGVASLVYLPLFWNNSGLLGEPANAIRSAFAPSTRDFLSNEYRRYEDANLKADIKRSTPFGTGFGLVIDYTTFPFYDLTATVTSLRYEPHNSILYVWLRMGSLGALAFWFLIGAAFVAACRLARGPDRQFALLGTFIICALVAYLIEGYYDLGLSWFRVAVCIGCLLGALEAAGRLQTSAQEGKAERLVAA